jgi:hypothetical protein
MRTKKSAICIGVFLVSLTACAEQAAPPSGQQAAADPMSDGAENVRLVGYNDLQGRQSLQLTTRSDAANGNWVYVGHSPNNRSAPTAQEEGAPDEPQMNPITGAMEYNGTSLIDITDPSKPTTKWHIPGAKGANHRSVSVVYDYAAIRGRVLAGDSGRPLRRARITVSAPELGRESRNARSGHLFSIRRHTRDVDRHA